jgi:hypothetical protein
MIGEFEEINFDRNGNKKPSHDSSQLGETISLAVHQTKN